MATSQHLVLLLICSTLMVANAIDSIGLRSWYNNLAQKQMNLAELNFYVQDDLSSPTPTNIVVARANSSFTSPTFFGIVSVIDDPIRNAPSPNSTIVGRAQGFFAFSSLQELKIHMTFDLVFTSGTYNGSTLSIVGHNPYQNQNRELPIVGGSGAFRLARGSVLVNTVSSNSTTGDAFFNYNVFVLRYV